MGDARPNDHDHPALSHDLADHVGNADEFPACAEVVDHWAYYGTAKNGRSPFPFEPTPDDAWT